MGTRRMDLRLASKQASYQRTHDGLNTDMYELGNAKGLCSLGTCDIWRKGGLKGRVKVDEEG